MRSANKCSEKLLKSFYEKSDDFKIMLINIKNLYQQLIRIKTLKQNIPLPKFLENSLMAIMTNLSLVSAIGKPDYQLLSY